MDISPRDFIRVSAGREPATRFATNVSVASASRTTAPAARSTPSATSRTSSTWVKLRAIQSRAEAPVARGTSARAPRRPAQSVFDGVRDGLQALGRALEAGRRTLAHVHRHIVDVVPDPVSVDPHDGAARDGSDQ